VVLPASMTLLRPAELKTGLTGTKIILLKRLEYGLKRALNTEIRGIIFNIPVCYLYKYILNTLVSVKKYQYLVMVYVFVIFSLVSQSQIPAFYKSDSLFPTTSHPLVT
jgi:hypothetical protein